MKDEFDIPTGDIIRDYEMLTCETFLEFYGSDLEFKLEENSKENEE
jgi:hypothetical protein